MIVKKICNFLSTVVLLLLAAVAAIILVPMLLGYKEMAVLTGSMEPNIPVGSLIYVKPLDDPAVLQPGDVCTYLLKDGETMVTHRVVSVDPETSTLITKGDANEVEDGPVAFSQVFGETKFHLPYLGYIAMNIKTPTGIMVVCGVLVVVILLNFIPAIIDAGEEDKKKALQAAESSEKEE
ncbi:signal peptidase I [Gemmiger sp. An120]|uniref:signal peptidase I n=1 Tax=Gemmiger sp. An120 TaxID=1965549 RepID=UPI000B3864CD|nr:signal peptidase I [Gemmiger sp. An120]OUQ42528.1 signal peptidase I [Gemmiger sp. An120]